VAQFLNDPKIAGPCRLPLPRPVRLGGYLRPCRAAPAPPLEFWAPAGVVLVSMLATGEAPVPFWYYVKEFALGLLISIAFASVALAVFWIVK
jgi:hypothetical protein